MMDKKINRFLRLYPIYSGLTSDLLFYIAINTMFLTVVKSFSAAQIVSLTSISNIACIVIQFPLLKIIHKIGNTAASRVSALLLLLSAIFITFGPNYYFIVIGRLFHDVSVVFHGVVIVALENNLELIGKRENFIHSRTAANTVYSVLTMLIAFIAGPMFNAYYYLPMYCCIGTCAIGFVLSFFMVDYSKHNKIPQKNNEKVKLNFNKLLVLVVIVYGMFMSLAYIGQSEEQLFIQQNLLSIFSVENTTLILTAIICISRIVRVFSNVAFAYIYRRIKDKVGVFMHVLLCVSITLVLFGSFMPHVLSKIILMGIGFTIILFVRDPFKLYIQDVVLEQTAKEHHQTILTLLAFAMKVGTATISLAFTLVLLKYPLFTVMAILLVLAIIELLLSIMLYKEIVVAKRLKAEKN